MEKTINMYNIIFKKVEFLIAFNISIQNQSVLSED